MKKKAQWMGWILVGCIGIGLFWIGMGSHVIGASAPSDSSRSRMLRIYLCAQQKGPAPGIHDRQKIVDDFWNAMVNRGAVTSAGIVYPAPLLMVNNDVILFYGPPVWPKNRKNFQAYLESYLLRGGGLVLVHHAIQDPNLVRLKEWTGTPWVTNQTRWVKGIWRLNRFDPKHPLSAGLQPVEVEDVGAVGVRLEAQDHVLIWAQNPKGQETPVLWVREKDGQRTVVFTLGHFYRTFQQPEIEELLARALAWAGHHNVDYLLTVQEKERLQKALQQKPKSQPQKESASPK